MYSLIKQAGVYIVLHHSMAFFCFVFGVNLRIGQNLMKGWHASIVLFWQNSHKTHYNEATFFYWLQIPCYNNNNGLTRTPSSLSVAV